MNTQPWIALVWVLMTGLVMSVSVHAEPVQTTKTATAPAGLLCDLISGDEARVLSATPRFSWIVPHVAQTAYQIIVEDAAGKVHWDSGRVESAASVAVPMKGEGLAADVTYTWRVRTWAGGVVSPWSGKQRIVFTPTKGPYTVAPRSLRVTPIAPVKVVSKGQSHWFVDFARAGFGTVELTLDAPGPQDVTVHLGEKLDDATTISRKPGGTIRYRAIALTLKPGRNTYRVTIPPDKRNSSGAAVLMPRDLFEVMPFRYMELEGYAGELEAGAVRMLRVTYPFDEAASSFESSDETLNAVWEMCRYTIEATSFLGVYVDGDRERIPYEADAYINQLAHYGVDREYAMGRYSHEYLLFKPTWPTEWILHSVLMAHADWLYTGDTASIQKHYDTLRAKTLLALARPDGLITTHGGAVTKDILKSIHFNANLRDIVDWPQGERDGHDMKPINTVVNAFHYRALRDMAELATAIGKSDDARQFQQQADKVAAAINDKLFNTATGLYLDGEGSTHSSLHANMLPLAFGLVPQDRRDKVVDFVVSRGMACSVYGAQYLLDALYLAGRDQAALDLMRSRGERSWYNMIRVGSTVALEAWDSKFKPNLDWNHAWGAVPANAIPRFVAGVQPLEPGFATARIAPAPGSLEFFRAKVPTIRGPVHVEYHRLDKGYRLRLTLPGNCPAQLLLPQIAPGAAATVTLNNKPVQPRVADSRLVIDGLTPGEHLIVVSLQ